MKRTMWTSSLAGFVVAGALAMVPVQGVMAQQVSDATPSQASAGATAESMPLEQLLPMTVHEAWVASGRNEDKFYAMVSQLTALSAQKRGVTLPDSTEAGQRAGKVFKQIARKDPGQLLYVAVDTMVRKTAENKAGTATTAGQ